MHLDDSEDLSEDQSEDVVQIKDCTLNRPVDCRYVVVVGCNQDVGGCVGCRYVGVGGCNQDVGGCVDCRYVGVGGCVGCRYVGVGGCNQYVGGCVDCTINRYNNQYVDGYYGCFYQDSVDREFIRQKILM